MTKKEAAALAAQLLKVRPFETDTQRHAYKGYRNHYDASKNACYWLTVAWENDVNAVREALFPGNYYAGEAFLKDCGYVI